MRYHIKNTRKLLALPDTLIDVITSEIDTAIPVVTLNMV